MVANYNLRNKRFEMKYSGLCIVFLGPDGCGKTTVAHILKEQLKLKFPLELGAHFHWKPVKKNTLDSSSPVTDPHSSPLRNRFMSPIYFIYHYISFFLGWQINVLPVLKRGGLVIIDRYYYDFFVDLRRYRLNISEVLIKLGFKWIQKPDLVFCLDADPSTLQQRKKEVSFVECKRQRESYKALVEKLSNGHVIDASQSLDGVMLSVKNIVLNHLAKNNRGG